MRGCRHAAAVWLWAVLALAALPTAVSLLCTTQAIHYIGSTPTAILGALEPVTAVFFGGALEKRAFSELCDAAAFTGSFLEEVGALCDLLQTHNAIDTAYQEARRCARLM